MRRIALFPLFCLVLLGPACAPRTPSTVSVEQTHDSAAPEAPTLERRQHLASLGALKWHADGKRGRGVKVAVLDSGFRNYRQFLGKGLPAQVKTRSFRKDQNLEARDSQHGILCAEVLHAIAPDAEMLLVNWDPDSPQAFLDAIRWATAEGATVLTCSLIMPSWSDGEGGGEVHRALAQILGDRVLFFASAGNTAQRHWCGNYTPAQAGWHQWRDGVVENELKPWGGERVAVELYGPTQGAFELAIHHSDTGDLLGKSVLRVDSTKTCGRAVVRFEPEKGKTYQIRVRSLDGANARTEAFHLVALGAALEIGTTRGSIPFPGDGAEVLAIGAVDLEGRRASYSSCGPNSRAPKPDFVATVPFPSMCRQRAFTGTSAAAPQAAALAAILWSSRPLATGPEIVQALRDEACDLGPAGHDHETGFGLIRLPR
jgi:subtilisin family serine protease